MPGKGRSSRLESIDDKLAHLVKRFCLRPFAPASRFVFLGRASGLIHDWSPSSETSLAASVPSTPLSVRWGMIPNVRAASATSAATVSE